MLVGWWYWEDWCHVAMPVVILASAVVYVRRSTCHCRPSSMYLGTFTVERKALWQTPLRPHDRNGLGKNYCNKIIRGI